jgi:sigma-E factor negative regulatory protein RseC
LPLLRLTADFENRSTINTNTNRPTTQTGSIFFFFSLLFEIDSRGRVNLATEEGVVIKIGNSATPTAWVKTTRSSACKSCAARESCNADGAGKEMQVEAINSAGAKVGDRIVISIKTASLLKATFLIYIFPILAMLAGAFVGQELAIDSGSQDPSGLSALVAFIFLGLAVLIVKLLGKAMALKKEYTPAIIRIIAHSSDQNG